MPAGSGRDIADDLLGGHDADDAGQLERGGDVDRADAGVGERRSHDRRVARVRDGLDVVHEAPLTAQERLVLDAGDAPARRTASRVVVLTSEPCAAASTICSGVGPPCGEGAKRRQDRARVVRVTLRRQRQRLAERAATVRARPRELRHQATRLARSGTCAGSRRSSSIRGCRRACPIRRGRAPGHAGARTAPCGSHCAGSW